MFASPDQVPTVAHTDAITCLHASLWPIQVVYKASLWAVQLLYDKIVME